MQSTGSKVEAWCLVRGTVQGVGFRDFVSEAAQGCGIQGWVRNETDGTVRVCAQGTPDALKELVEYLHEGSVMSQVTAVEVEWRDVDVVYDDFGIWR